MAMIHIVDDEPNVLFLMGEALRRRGYEVATFGRPEEYLEVVREKPDLLITDLLMPAIDGVGFCAALRSDVSMRKVPIVVCTGLVLRDGQRSDEALRERFGVQAIITKPFPLKMLFDCVERLVGPQTETPREKVAIAPEIVAQQKAKPLAQIPLRQVRVQPTLGTRLEPRFDASFEVSFSDSAALSKEYTENISRGGMFIRTASAPPPGTEIKLQLRVPWETIAVQLTAIVAHVVAQGAGATPGFGVRFTQLDREALDRWHGVVMRVSDQLSARARGPRVLLLGFSGERVADLMQKAGVLCRADLRIVPLASWQSVMREAEKHPDIPKLLVIDVGIAEGDLRASFFDSQQLRAFANLANVSLAYVGLSREDESNLPTELHVIKAGALTSADLMTGIVSWCGLPERVHVRVPASGTASVTMEDRLLGAELLDISRGGARALAREELHPGDKVLLTFLLATHGGIEDLRAEVRWAKPEGRGKWMCGVVFVDERKEALLRIDAYVEEQARYLLTLEAFKS